VLLRLEAEGASGWGEAAPLSGFSRETPAQAARALQKVLPGLLGLDLEEARLPRGGLPPSARFALELALLGARAAASGRPLPELLSPSPQPEVEVSALLSGPPETVLEEARRMRAAGYRAFKLKVGGRPVEEDVRLVRSLGEELGGSVTLRLDANRAWEFPEALRFAAAGLRFLYVEEPLRDPAGLPELVRRGNLPVALDESLFGMEPEGLAGHRYARAAVLKPTLLGGLSRTLRFARAARELGMEVAVSSAYESGVGTLGLLALAAACGAPAGLDPYRSLARDVLRPRPALAAPRLVVGAAFSARRAVAREALEELLGDAGGGGE